MPTMLAAIALVILAMLGLAIGLAFGKPPLQRACGGTSCQNACTGCDRIKEALSHD